MNHGDAIAAWRAAGVPASYDADTVILDDAYLSVLRPPEAVATGSRQVRWVGRRGACSRTWRRQVFR